MPSQSVLQVRPPSRSRPSSSSGLPSAQRALACRGDASEPAAHDHHVVHQLLPHYTASTATAPWAGRPHEHRVASRPLPQPARSPAPPRSAASLAGGRNVDGLATAPTEQQRRAAQRTQRDSIAAASAGSGTIATSSSSSVQIPPSASTNAGTIASVRTATSARPRMQPCARRAPAVVRRREFGKPGGRRPAPRQPIVSPSATPPSSDLCCTVGRAQFQCHGPRPAPRAPPRRRPRRTRLARPGPGFHGPAAAPLASCSASHRPSPRSPTVRATRQPLSSDRGRRLVAQRSAAQRIPVRSPAAVGDAGAARTPTRTRRRAARAGSMRRASGPDCARPRR